MGEQVRFPLSGDVSQWFNIWSHFNSNGQIGLFNIQLGDSSDAALEHDLIQKVGSYGRQIGQLTDMVEVLLALVPKDDLAKLGEEHEEAITRFRRQADHVRLVKAENRGGKRAK